MLARSLRGDDDDDDDDDDEEEGDLDESIEEQDGDEVDSDG